MNRWKRWLPGLRILSEYQAAWFPRDVMAGLVLAVLPCIALFLICQRWFIQGIVITGVKG